MSALLACTPGWSGARLTPERGSGARLHPRALMGEAGARDPVPTPTPGPASLQAVLRCAQAYIYVSHSPLCDFWLCSPASRACFWAPPHGHSSWEEREGEVREREEAEGAGSHWLRQRTLQSLSHQPLPSRHSHRQRAPGAGPAAEHGQKAPSAYAGSMCTRGLALPHTTHTHYTHTPTTKGPGGS